MIVAPIVFCVVVHGIAGAGDLKKVGRVGGKALLYFEVMTTVALVGRAVPRLRGRPGVGMNINTASLDAERAQHLLGQRVQAAWRRLQRLHPQHHPDHLVRRAGPQRRAAGAVLRHHLRRQPGPGRRPRQAGHRPGRDGVQGAVPRHGADRARGAARRAGRGRLHGRPVRHPLAGAAGLAGRAVLVRRRVLRAGGAGRHHAGGDRPQHPPVPGLPARGADHRAGDRVVGRGAAADHAQAGADGRQAVRRGPGGADRLLVQPRRVQRST